MKRLIFSALLFCMPLYAAPTASDEILVALQTCIEKGKSAEQLNAQLEHMAPAELKKLAIEIEKAWPRIRDQYLTALQGAAKSMSSGPAKNANRERISELRDQFQQVYALEEGPMKPLLHSKSMPAVEELQKLLLPDVDAVIKSGGMPLATLRQGAKTLGSFRDAVLNAELSTTPSDAMATLSAAEKHAAEEISGLDRDGLKILAANEKIAKEQEIPAAEAKGIAECNLWRLLLGMQACVLDPKLCEAARGHSTDMAEKGFFAHESPIAGKTTPWDRAAKAGTSASGENIYMGSTDPHGANEGWFYSPGHHKNMFNPGQARIGLGNSGVHWTQMFGR